MKKVITMGEALIDLIPDTVNCALKDVTGFKRVCGGAPANVAAAVGKLGGKAAMLTKLGNDGFGDYIVDVLNECNVDTSYIKRTSEANTALAFVSLKSDGNREFSFYRNPSADMLLSGFEIEEEAFDDTAVFHFGSVDLVECPIKHSHRKAIEIAKEKDAVISFDPNIRLALWNSEDECKKTVNEFIPYADLLKISDEELEFITGCDDEKIAFKKLFENENLKIILYSMGKNGAVLVTRNGRINISATKKVTAVDTTGAGDSIMGAFLYCLANDDVNSEKLSSLDSEILAKYLTFANFCSTYSVVNYGAIASYATMEEIKKFINE